MGEMEDCEVMEARPSVTPEPCVKKPKKPLSEEAKRVKRENDRQRGRTRVNLGPAYNPWKKLRDKNGFRSDAEMAFFLINMWVKYTLVEPTETQWAPGASLPQWTELNQT